MSTDLGYFHVFQNCFYSTYGRKSALKNGERKYCLCGEQYFVHNNQRVPGKSSVVCWDWQNGKCKGLQEITKIVR